MCAVTVKPMSDPASTLSASAVLVRLTFGHSTVVDASAVRLGALVEVSDAVFGYVAQLANVVGLTTCTLKLPFGPLRSSTVQFSTLAVIEQPGVAGEIDQLTPVPVGSGSLIVTP